MKQILFISPISFRCLGDQFYGRGVKSAGYNRPITGNRVPTGNRITSQPVWYLVENNR
jgi:hypothetical protein